MDIEFRWTKVSEFTNIGFLNENTVIFGGLTTLCFLNLIDGETTYYRTLDKSINGTHLHGLSCLVGHRNQTMFAFGEMSSKPKIILLTYPEFTHIITLENPQTHGPYISLDFSETEHLVAITALPEFLIEIWNWRTGKLLAIEETGLTKEIQWIKCSPSFPLTVTQLARDFKTIIFWEISISMDSAMTLKRTIELPTNATTGDKLNLDFCYSLDGSIFVIDQCSTVWQIYPQINKITEIFSGTPFNSNFLPHIVFFRNGLVITCFDGSMKHLKKVENDWLIVWDINIGKIANLLCFEHQNLVFLSEDGALRKINDENVNALPEFEDVAVFDRYFKFIVPINPSCDYFMSVTEDDNVSVLDFQNGRQISRRKMESIHCIESHPCIPLIAIGTTTGRVLLISTNRPDQPKIISELYLSYSCIKYIQFTTCENSYVASDFVGYFYLIGDKLGDSMTVRKCVESERPSIGFTVCKMHEIFHIMALFLPVNSNSSITDSCAASNIFAYTALSETENAKWILFQMEKNYSFVQFSSTISNKRIIATQFLSKSIDLLEVVYDSDQSVQIATIFTCELPNMMHFIESQCYDNWLLVWSFDGMMSILKKDSFEIIKTYHAHNKYTRGVKKGICDSLLNHVVSLGHSGNLACFQVVHSIAQGQSNEVLNEYSNFGDNEILRNAELNFVLLTKDTPWLESHKEKQKTLEHQKYLATVRKIRQNFNNIKEQLQKCINLNQLESDDAILPIHMFNIDVDGTEALNEMTRKRCQIEHEELLEFCKEQEKTVNWIKQNTWDLMEVKSLKLRGIFSSLCIENYPLRVSDHDSDLAQEITIFQRKKECSVSAVDIFLPWIPKSTSELENELTIMPNIVRAIDGFKGNECDSFNNKIRGFSHSGTSTHLFIKPLCWRYSQLEVVTYNQIHAEYIMSFHDTLALRRYFNQTFDEMVKQKQQVTESVKKRNDRLRYIQDELNILEQLNGSHLNYHDELIIDPEYSADEKPGAAIEVSDSEVSAMPYMSPSEEKALEEEQAQEELARKKMLENDFTERALQNMMDGVLEIRWEDEIKKEPKKPRCLELGFHPKDYLDDDLKEIAAYEEKIKQLRSERQRYHDILLEERQKIQNDLDVQILNFNRNAGHLFRKKLQIDFAINSEELKLLLYSKFSFERIKLQEKEVNSLKEMEFLRNEIDELMKTLNEIEANLSACKTKYEELSVKDRLLDRQFKTTFAEHASQAVVDQAYRVFRRRPKWQMRAWQTPAILLDMARRINTADSSADGPPLPEECFQYLGLIEASEKFSNAPNLMDQASWQIVCKMRRIKIETEFKVRSCGVQLAETEATFNAYSKEISAKRAKLIQCDKNIEELKAQKAKHSINRNIQFYIKRNNVEIPLSGRLSDFENAILLHKRNLIETNTLIEQVGSKKIKVMEDAAVFKRHVQYHEWKHKILKFKMENIKEDIKTINKCKVTKEVLAWLKRKQMGWTEELNENVMEREISRKIASYERTNHDLMKRIDQIETSIANENRQNDLIDRRIQNLNVAIEKKDSERNLLINDEEFLRRGQRMSAIIERARLVRKIQKQHVEILEHSTLLELQRLRTYPTLNAPKSSTSGKLVRH